MVWHPIYILYNNFVNNQYLKLNNYIYQNVVPSILNLKKKTYKIFIT